MEDLEKTEERIERINNLMRNMLERNYKELCDKLKSEILQSLINVSRTKDTEIKFITDFELEYIKEGIDNLRTKEREEESKAIVDVIQHLINRGNEEID